MHAQLSLLPEKQHALSHVAGGATAVDQVQAAVNFRCSLTMRLIAHRALRKGRLHIIAAKRHFNQSPESLEAEDDLCHWPW
jgi:hypothetical protein